MLPTLPLQARSELITTKERIAELKATSAETVRAIAPAAISAAPSPIWRPPHRARPQAQRRARPRVRSAACLQSPRARRGRVTRTPPCTHGQERRLSEATRSLERLTREAEEGTAKASYLAQDKEYLRVQVKSLEERLSGADGRVAKKEATIAELKAELSKARDDLLQMSRGHADDTSARLEAEKLRWESHASASASAHADAHAAAVATHKDARELALIEADKWQTRYIELKREHDAAVLGAAEAAGRAEATAAELRAECKLRAFEGERLRLQCEEALVSARQAHVDCNAGDQKLELLKAEYYALQTSSATRIAELEASSASLATRVSTYEQLELELDRTVLQAGALEASGGGDPAEGGGGGGGGGGGSSRALQPFIRVPSSAQRRMEQCLGLARDLLASQKAAAEAEAKLANATAEVARLQSVVAELQRKVQQAGRPQSYLAEQVETAERQRLEAEAQAASLRQKLAEHADALATARHQNDLLLRDMESLLSQRGSLDALRATLSRLLPPDLAPAIAA